MEEKRRWEEIEKIRMEIVPKLPRQPTEKWHTTLTLSLKAGPLSEVLRLERFISMVENYGLKGLVWERREAMPAIIQQYEKVKVPKEPLKIVYSIAGGIESNQIAHIAPNAHSASKVSQQPRGAPAKPSNNVAYGCV